MKQFLVNYDKKLNRSFISNNDVTKYFQPSSTSLIEYTKTEGYKKYYADLHNADLGVKMNSVKMQSEIENSLFERKSFQGQVFSGAKLKKDFLY